VYWRASFSKQEMDESFSPSAGSHILKEGEKYERIGDHKNETSPETGTRLLPSMRRVHGVGVRS
jgi:hypothetical protein